MSFVRNVAWVWALSTSLAGCSADKLISTHHDLEIVPAKLDFGIVDFGSHATLDMSIINVGPSPLAVSYSPLPEGLTLEVPAVLESGGNRARWTFAPTKAGLFETTWKVSAQDLEKEVTVQGYVLPGKTCVASSACKKSTFNSVTQQCEETNVEEGTSCGSESLCLQGGTCLQGQCVGRARNCDDANACTVDVCNPNTGCEHLPAPPCPSQGACQEGVCDPKLGCTTVAADDGTLCGPTQTCDVADVCISGKCVQRNPPDGYTCAPASPCQSAGKCQGSTCVRTDAVPLKAQWSFDSYLDSLNRAGPEQGDDFRELHDLVLEPNGNMSLMGFFAVPRLRANTSMAADGETAARRCILWNAHMVCADYPYTSSGKVSAVNLSNGQRLWTHDLPASRPDLAAQTAPGRMFLARVAALGPDRLAALFEAYPKGTTTDTQCRSYFLSVVDAAGNMISSQKLNDPFLDICSHPHPYGVAADAVGNLFISFSQSDVGVAPLFPQSPSLLMSFTRDGLLRWQRVENFVGGELAVARGLIYPEKSDTAFVTSTGAPFTVGGLPTGLFGRIVATSNRVIPSPQEGSTSLTGIELEAQGPTYKEIWKHVEPEGFASSQIRLATWKDEATQSTETVALTFVFRNGKTHLLALRAPKGQEMWSCPLEYNARSNPQLMEVAQNTLALMDGSTTCGTCDPPFANSSAAFYSFNLPGLGVADEPWVGTFGGAGHDHLEDGQRPAPPTPPVP